MKKFILCGLIAFSALAVTITSCNKYEDGPKISLLTKKMRVTGDWSLEQYLANGTTSSNGTDITSSMQSFLGSTWEWQIEKDGSYKSTGNVNENGTWALGEDKDDITFTPPSTSSSSPSTYRILKLKSKELWLRYTNTNGTYDVIHLKQ